MLVQDEIPILLPDEDYAKKNWRYWRTKKRWTQYMRTAWIKQLRSDTFFLQDWRCWVSNCINPAEELHHCDEQAYRRVFCEVPGIDVIGLCADHHRATHGKTLDIRQLMMPFTCSPPLVP